MVNEQVSDFNFKDEISLLKPKKSKYGGEAPSRVTRVRAKVKNAKDVSNKKSQKVCKYQFKGIVFTNEKIVKDNLLAIHQDSFVQQDQDKFVHPDVDGGKHSSSNVRDEQIFDIKNELTNVDKQFKEVKQYVAESVKTVLNELMSAGIKSDEFSEDQWICAIEQQWLGGNKDMRYISPEHYVGLYIIDFKMLANVSGILWTTLLFHLIEPAYIDKVMIDPLEYVIVRDVSQQAP
ncbi:hypothetical protein FXO38_08440 [Capsicum annuum]|nr:hypothetical protein FXO38_08440 [Capsicum annuum]